VVRFVDELVAVARRAGATGPVTLRAGSGFWAWKLIDRLDAHKICWSVTVRLHKHLKQVAETIYTTGKGTKARSVRSVVRRTRLTDRAQRRLWPDCWHHEPQRPLNDRG
jgi:hypothetical protein